MKLIRKERSYLSLLKAKLQKINLWVASHSTRLLRIEPDGSHCLPPMHRFI